MLHQTGTKGSADRDSRKSSYSPKKGPTNRSEQLNKQHPRSRFRNPFERDIDRAAILEDHRPFPVALAEGFLHITENDIPVFKRILATWTTDDSFLSITPEQAASCLRQSLLKPQDLGKIFHRATTLQSPIIEGDNQMMDFIEFFVAIKLAQQSTGLDYRQLEERLKKSPPKDRGENEKEQKEKEQKEKGQKEKEKAVKEKAEKEKKEKEIKENEEAEKQRRAEAERVAAEAARQQYVPYVPPAPILERFTCCNDLYTGSMRCRCGKGGPTNLGRATPFFLRRG